MFCNDRPRTRGVLRNRKHEACVVRPCIIIESCSRQSALCDSWLSLPGLLDREPRSARQRLLLRQQIVEKQNEPEDCSHETLRDVHQDEEREREDEVPSGPEQPVQLSDGSPL